MNFEVIGREKKWVFIRFCRISYKLKKYAKKNIYYFIGTFSQVFGSLIIFAQFSIIFELHYYVKKNVSFTVSPHFIYYEQSLLLPH